MRSLFLLGMIMISLSDFAQQVDTSARYQDLQEVVITAQYLPQSEKASVYKIKTLDREVINHVGATNLRELLYHELNLDIAQQSVFGSSPEIQGLSKENVKILIDGVPVIGRLNGVIDLNQIHLSNIERVEIIEGPTSVFYGSDAIAGTINLITRKTIDQNLMGEVSGYTESVGQYNVNGLLGFSKKNSTFQLSGGAGFFNGYSESDTDRSSDWEKRDQYHANAGYNYAFKDLRTYLNGRFFQELLTDKGVPDEMNEADDVYYTTRRWSTETGVKGEFAKHSYTDLAFSYLDYNRWSNTYHRNFSSGLESFSDKAGDHDTTKFKTWFVKYQYSWRKLSSPVSFSLGSEMNFENTEGRRILDKKQSAQDYAFFGSLKYTPVDWLTIQPGLRWSVNNRYKAPLSPAVNLHFQPGQSANIRLSYAMGYRAPSLKELYLDFTLAAGPFVYHITGNEALRAERSQSLNLSYDQHIRLGDKQSLDLEARLFYNRMKNLIALSEIVDFSRHYININEYETHGGNLTLTYHPVSQLAIKTGISVIGRQNQFANELDVKPNLYSIHFVASAKYSLIKHHFSAGLNYKFYGPKQGFIVQRSGEIEETTIEEAHLLDLNLTKSFKDELFRIDAGIKNLLSIKNSTTLGTQSGEAHSSDLFFWGRSFYLKLKFRISKGLDKSRAGN